MASNIVDDLSKLSLGEKVVVECGDGDSATIANQGGSENTANGDGSDAGGVNGCAGTEGDEAPAAGATSALGSDGEGQEDLGHLKSDENSIHRHHISTEALELFKTTVTKKKNIYSTDPVPLNSPWTFWVDRTERGVNVQQFEANLKRIYTVYTVHRFWGVFYNIPKPSDLQCRSSLHMMRDERKPVWEESYNCKGGTFRLRVQKKDTDKVWKEMLMAAIGEQLNQYVDDSDEVCGITVSIRDREDVILVWNTNAEVASEATIFDCVRLLLPDTNFLSTFYKPHETHHAFEKSRRGMGAGGSKPSNGAGNSSSSRF